MTDLQAKSIILLIQYNVKGILKRQGYSDEFISLFPELNIYDETLNWKILVKLYKAFLKIYWRISSTSEIDDIQFFIDKSNNDHVKDELISKRIAFCVNKVFQIREHFFMLLDNHKDVKKQQEEFDSYNFEPYTAIIKAFGRKKVNVSSKENIKVLDAAFRKAFSIQYPLNNFILKNLPFKYLFNSNIESEKKIKAHFKKILKKEVWYYINKLSLNKSQKETLLGYLFFSIRLSLTRDEFNKWQEGKYQIADIKDEEWEHYLRNEGRNCRI